MQPEIPKGYATNSASIGLVAGSTGRSDRMLRAATIVFALAVLVHNGDHLRRGGDSVSAQVFWVGSAAILVEVAVVVAVFLRHPTAPIAAVAAGFGLAAGYLLVHFTPQRGWLSDSLTSGDPSAFTVFAAVFETTASILLGTTGVWWLRRRGLAATTTSGGASVSLARAVAHPVVSAMIIGNAVVFVGSLVTRA
jgi:hypothetical protein